jgi:hypothetical protein
MHYIELQKPLDRVFKKLGYRENKPYHWVTETQELIIILSLKVDDWKKDLHIDIGILFKKLYKGYTWEEPAFEDHDIGTGLYNILRDMGEWEYYLNNLFSYDSTINTDAEVKNNISEIGKLFQTKVIPYFEELEICARLAKNFEEKTTWIPFLQYFRPSKEHNEYFGGILEMYWWKHREKM